MKTYAKIAGEGFALFLVPVLAIGYAIIVATVLPFFLIGLVKRGVVSAITGGDPLVP